MAIRQLLGKPFLFSIGKEQHLPRQGLDVQLAFDGQQLPEFPARDTSTSDTVQVPEAKRLRTDEARWKNEIDWKNTNVANRDGQSHWTMYFGNDEWMNMT